MSEQCKYYCRVCGAEVIAGPYIAPEACGACQLAANAEIARKAKGEHDLLKQLRRRPYSNPPFWMLEAADEIERLKADVAELRKNQITPEIILRVASLHKTIREQAERIEKFMA